MMGSEDDDVITFFGRLTLSPSLCHLCQTVASGSFTLQHGRFTLPFSRVLTYNTYTHNMYMCIYVYVYVYTYDIIYIMMYAYDWWTLANLLVKRLVVHNLVHSFPNVTFCSPTSPILATFQLQSLEDCSLPAWVSAQCSSRRLQAWLLVQGSWSPSRLRPSD